MLQDGTRRRSLVLVACLSALAIFLLLAADAPPAAGDPGTTERVSVDTAGNQGNGSSCCAAMSAHGRYVAFASRASNLVPSDTNGVLDVFVRDRQTGITERVSVDSAGNQGDDGSGGMGAAISADGRYVAFDSYATNLVPGDTNGAQDVFVHDRQASVTERVSVNSAGNQANGGSRRAAISGDGRFVAFASSATNLVAGDTNAESDIFVHDRETGITERVSVDSAGNQGDGSSGGWRVAISADGRYVAFESYATNFVPGDTNGTGDLFVHDRETGVTERVGSGGFWPSVSADGRYVAFTSWASDLVTDDTNAEPDVFVHDRETGITERVSVDSAGDQSNGQSFIYGPSISADGRYMAFVSTASNLVISDTNAESDIFVHDRETGITERVSVDSAGNQGDDGSGGMGAAISADGRYVAFNSYATNLVPGDTNGYADVFVHNRGPAPTPTPTPTPTPMPTPTPTLTPTPPPAVGGIVEIQVDGSGSAVASAADSSDGSSLHYYIALAGAAAVGALVIAASAWYARRRWLA